MRAGRVSRQLATELPAIEEVTPQPVSGFEAPPAEELRIAAAPAPPARTLVPPPVPALPEPTPAALDALAAATARLRDGVPPQLLAALDAPGRAALAPRLEAAAAMLRECAALLALRDEATGRLRTGGRV